MHCGLLSPRVLAACAGMVAASLSCLAPGASFSEVSKRSIWSPQRIAMERPDVTYHLVAIDFHPSAVVCASMTRLSAEFATGDFHD